MKLKEAFLRIFQVFVLLALATVANVHAEEQSEAEQSKAEQSKAEQSTANKALESLKDTVTPYASLRVRIVEADGDSEIQDGSSRVGLKLRREVSSNIALIGRVEMQVNLVDDPTVLTLGDSTGSELVAVENVETFATRLGWLGLDMGKAGRLTVGKQWSAYYDVAGWTDQYYVFGGTSLGIYTTGTDGGALGTGRAEQAVIWRNELGPIAVGLQFQLKGDSSRNAQSLGASLRATLAEGLQLGVSYNEADLREVEGIEEALILEDDPRSFAVGLRFEKGPWHAALTYADQRQTEVGTREDELAFFDSTGYELYVRFGLDDRFGLFGGGNWRDAEDEALSVAEDIEQYFLGVDWHFHDKAFVYFQGRLAEEGGRDALAVGLRYNL